MFCNVKEAAAKSGMSEATIYRWISDGRLPAYRMGLRQIRIKKDDLDALLTPIVH